VFGVSLRTRLIRTFVATLIALVAVISVGLTAPADGPFTIGIRPAFFRLDPESVAESRANAFGLDVDVKFGQLHLHFNWSAIPLTTSTKPTGTLL
jgi:hypothetical protein